MLASLIRFSTQQRGIVITIAAVILVFGALELPRTGLDIFPEFSPKQVIIQTEATGLSAEQVEILVTHPVESTIRGLNDLKSVRSESIQGLSIVTADFADHTDIQTHRTRISERLANVAAQLPPDIAPPVVVPLSSSSATILTMGAHSESLNLMELRTVIDRSIVPGLMAVPGVADVNVFGGEVRQLQIRLIPKLLQKYGVGIGEVHNALSRATGIHGTGFIENTNQQIPLRLTNLPATPQQIAGVIIRQSGDSVITAGDIARVEFAPEPRISAARINGEPAVVIMVIGQYGANTLTVSNNVQRMIADLSPILRKQGIRFHPDLFRPADYILTSLRNLSSHLLLGALFVVIVLFLFLYNARTALISTVAIPLSLISAAIVLLQAGVSLNIMVLGGLAIALGEVVDDAIIDTENIFRRLRENRLKTHPEPVTSVVFSASMEVRKSVTYATFIVALVFVPLLSLEGVTGRLFAPLATAYIVAILMSLLVAVTVTPAMCSLLLRPTSTPSAPPPLIRWLTPRYERLLEQLLRSGPAIPLAILATCLLSTLMIPFNSENFLPHLREGHYIVHTSSVPGTSLDESVRIGNRLSAAFREIPGVVSVSQWAGRAERGADTFGSHYSEYEVRLEQLPGPAQQDVLDRLREILGEFPGIGFEANTFLTERIDETISGYTAPVVINIYGDNLDSLDTIARKIAGIVRSVAGASGVQLRSPPGTPLLDIRIRHDSMTLHGVRSAEIIRTVKTAFEGSRIGRIHAEGHTMDAVVIFAPEYRTQPDQVRDLPVKTVNGDSVSLHQVADIRQAGGRYNILHRNGRRLQTVTSQIQGRDLRSFMQEIRKRVASGIDFPGNYYPEFTGTAVENTEAEYTLLMNSALAGAIVLVLIYLALGNLRLTLITLANLPFSLAGGLLTVALGGMALSIGSMVGFVTLFGITVRNSIMLITHYQHLVRVENHPWNMQTAIIGARQRLPSILMTALVTALAMLPIAVNSDNPGREIMGPMASIIIGGLVSSTFLNLLLLPSILLRYGNFDRGNAAA